MIKELLLQTAQNHILFAALLKMFHLFLHPKNPTCTVEYHRALLSFLRQFWQQILFSSDVATHTRQVIACFQQQTALQTARHCEVRKALLASPTPRAIETSWRSRAFSAASWRRRSRSWKPWCFDDRIWAPHPLVEAAPQELALSFQLLPSVAVPLVSKLRTLEPPAGGFTSHQTD